MSALCTVMSIVAALLILWRTISVIASANVRTFNGHPWRFAFIALHWALLAGGAVAVVLGLPSAGAQMILVGLALMIIADRRRAH